MRRGQIWRCYLEDRWESNAMQCNGLDRIGGERGGGGTTAAPVTNRHWDHSYHLAATVVRIKVRER